MILLKASWGLSYACSIKPSSSRCDWFKRLFTLPTKTGHSKSTDPQGTTVQAYKAAMSNFIFGFLPVRFLEAFQCQDQQLGVMLVRQRGEGDGREPPALQPVDSGGVDGHCLLCGDVWAILKGRASQYRNTAPSPHLCLSELHVSLIYLQVIVLSFLFSLQVKPGEAAQVFLAHSFVDSSTTADTLPVVVSCVGPPISLGLHIS